MGMHQRSAEIGTPPLQHSNSHLRSLTWLLLLLPVVLMWIGAVVGDNGILKLWQLRNEIRHVEECNRVLEKKNKKKEKEIQLLKTNRTYIEAIARKELRYVRKGEKLYWFDKEATTPQPEEQQ